MTKRFWVFAFLFASTLSAAPRKFIVEFTASSASTPRISAQRFQRDASEVAIVRHEFSRALHGVAVELRDGQSVESLRQLPYVVSVVPDGEVIAFSEPATTTHAARFERPSSDASGNGVVVAVIDTGIDGTHPALAGKVLGGYDFVNNDHDPMDDHGHGTHVAGIIAAQSDEVTGVAPGVHLLAYKVLNAEGRGTTSGVIAAIERALDPNGDGNTSDHADIANLSLGDRGRPDDPLSRAVDNAVAAGMIVCVAAGNDETFHRIGSPAGAAKAITVGASTTEEGQPVVAYFTSRGPATGNGAIKPDLLAPGRDIYSTGLQHGYITRSGTSMATPYVSGLAALLLEEHPAWTPDRIKAALVSTASAVADEEVMTQGTGIADLSRARTNTLVPAPVQVNFGLDGTMATVWSSTRHFTLHNDGAAPRTVHATIEGATPAMTVVVAPAEATLLPGQTTDFEVTIHVDHTTLGKPRTRSFSFGGTLALTSNGENVRLPWAFVRAGRATITSDSAATDVLWLSDVPRYASAVSVGSGGMEVLLEPGVFDFVIASNQGDDLRLVIAEQRQVTGDVAVNSSAADAPHEIRFVGVDERGTPFPDADGANTLHSILARLLLPDGRTIALPDVRGRVVHTSPFSERYGFLAMESFVDRGASRVYVAQYDPLRNVSASRVLQVSPAEYASQEVELHFPPSGSRRDVSIMPRDWPRHWQEHRTIPPFLRFSTSGPTWHATLFLTKEMHPDVAGGVQFSLFTDDDANFPATLITPTVRRNDAGFFATWGFDELLPVGTIAGETMSFGGGVIYAPGRLQASDQGFGGDAEAYGHRGERRRNVTETGTVRVRDASGNEVASGPVTPGSFFVPLPRAGRFSAEVRFPSFAVDDQTGEALLTTTFDTRQGIASMPSVTSFAILDGAGRHTSRLPVNGNASLFFSAADFELGSYRRIVPGATRAFFRRRNTLAWQPLTPVATGDEETSDDIDRWPSGLIYRVDLREALRQGPGEYEIKLEIADEQGNTTTWQVAPAFIADVVQGGRRRAVGK